MTLPPGCKPQVSPISGRTGAQPFQSGSQPCVKHSLWPPTGPQQETHYAYPCWFFVLGFFVVVVVLVAHLGMWGLSSLARDQTHSPCIVGRVLTTGPWGKSLSLFWMYIFRFCVHILCSSISLDWDLPPLYFHLEIPLVFQGPTQTPPPFWSFPWSFSEGLPSPSVDLCFFLMQTPHFYSVACSCWLRTYSSLSSSPSRVEAPSLFIEWLIVSWSLGKTMKEGCLKPRSRQEEEEEPLSGLCRQSGKEAIIWRVHKPPSTSFWSSYMSNSSFGSWRNL